MAGLSQHLFALGRPNLERQLAHPTVRGIANGDLDPTRFRSWLVQDYLFLLDYVRLFALAAARAPDTDTLGRLVDLAHATFHQELSLHRAYAAEFGLAEVGPGPSREVARLRRLHRLPAAHRRDRRVRRGAGRAAALHVGLLRAGPDPGRGLACRAEPRYRRWIQTYADPDFAALAAWCAALLDRAADGLPVARLAACERAFLTSLRHELAFWDAE